jgi:hypothetical protein
VQVIFFKVPVTVNPPRLTRPHFPSIRLLCSKPVVSVCGWSEGAPDTARETLSVLFASKRYGVPLIRLLRRFNSTGAGTPDPIQRSWSPFRGFTVERVREYVQWDWRGEQTFGLPVAERSNAKRRDRSGTTTGGRARSPAKPVFLLAKNAPKSRAPCAKLSFSRRETTPSVHPLPRPYCLHGRWGGIGVTLGVFVRFRG